MDLQGEAKQVFNKFWPPWWGKSLLLRVETMLNHCWFVLYINTSVNENNYSVHDHCMTHWLEQHCLFSSLQLQIGQSDCNITNNCDKNLNSWLTLLLTLLTTSALNVETLSNGCYLLIEMVTLTWSFFSLLRLTVSFLWKFAVFNTTKDNHCILNKINGGGVSSRFCKHKTIFLFSPSSRKQNRVKWNREKILRLPWLYFLLLAGLHGNTEKMYAVKQNRNGALVNFSCDCYLMPSKLLYTGTSHGFLSPKSWEFFLTSR